MKIETRFEIGDTFYIVIYQKGEIRIVEKKVASYDILYNKDLIIHSTDCARSEEKLCAKTPQEATDRLSKLLLEELNNPE